MWFYAASLALLLPLVAVFSVIALRLLKRQLSSPQTAPLPSEAITKIRFSAKKLSKNYDTIIIGSGIGGLGCASALAQNGHKVLVLEQHDVAGGATHVFTEKGYEMDTGVHYIGDNVGNLDRFSPFRILLDIAANNGVKWNKMDDVFDIAMCYKTGERFAMCADYKKLVSDLILKFPDEEESIHEYMSACDTVRKSFGVFFIITSFFPTWLAVRLLPWAVPCYKRLFCRTTKEVISEIVKNEKLRGVLTYIFGDYMVRPEESAFAVHAATFLHYEGGAFYPKGGSSTFAKHLVSVIQQHGGQVFVSAPVNSILIEGNKAVGVNVKGVEIHCKTVVSAAGVRNTYKRLIPEKYSDQIPKALLQMLDTESLPLDSLLSVFIGINNEEGKYKFPAANTWAFPTWDHDHNIKSYLRRDISQETEEVDVPGVFISFSSAKDLDYEQRCPGKEACLAIGFVPYKWFEKFENAKVVRHRGEEYEDLKNAIGDSYVEVLQSVFPEIDKGDIEYLEVGSPLTNNYYLGYVHGEVYGIPSNLWRITDAWKYVGIKTPFKGLYLAGMDVVSSGVVPSFFGGLLCACVVDPFVFVTLGTAMFWRFVHWKWGKK